jgi:hypothetical protein
MATVSHRSMIVTRGAAQITILIMSQTPPPLPYATPGGTSCPRCGSTANKPVGFSWWGGVLGPRLFHHVRCQGCGFCFNSKTGRSNNTAIAIYVAVTLVVVIVLLAAFHLR